MSNTESNEADILDWLNKDARRGVDEFLLREIALAANPEEPEELQYPEDEEFGIFEPDSDAPDAPRIVSIRASRAWLSILAIAILGFVGGACVSNLINQHFFG